MDLKEMGCEAMKWINIVQGRGKWLVIVKVLLDFTLSIP